MDATDYLHPEYRYSIAVEPMSDGRFRGTVTVFHRDERVERSGLIGPRFGDQQAAENFALEWAQRWVARHAQQDVVVEASETRQSKVDRSAKVTRLRAAA